MDDDRNDVESLRAKLTQNMFRESTFPGMDALVALVPRDGGTSDTIKIGRAHV
jgi:hypothetical protein